MNRKVIFKKEKSYMLKNPYLLASCILIKPLSKKYIEHLKNCQPCFWVTFVFLRSMNVGQFSYFFCSGLLPFSLSTVLMLFLTVCVFLTLCLGKPFVLAFFRFSLKVYSHRP